MYIPNAYIMKFWRKSESAPHIGSSKHSKINFDNKLTWTLSTIDDKLTKYTLSLDNK